MAIRGPDVTQPKPKPFLRWAGGKTWLARQLTPLLPKDGFKNYHEPFLGGGSVYLTLNPQGTSFLSDLNQELIDTYVSVRDILPNVICQVPVPVRNRFPATPTREKTLGICSNTKGSLRSGGGI